MKLNFNKEALQEVLGLITSIIPARTPKPVLRSVKIKVENKEVKISATNLEIGINYRVPQVDVEEEGETVIPADRFAAIVRESIDEIISLEASEATCHIRGADSHFTIYGHEPSQFPVVPDFEGDGQIKVVLGKLQEGIEQCLFAAAKESTRYAINGVLWEVKGKKLVLVATDGRRLARTKVDLISAAEELSSRRIIVPAQTMGLLGRIPAEPKEKVAVKFVDNKVVISCADVVISSNLVEGNFPKYEDIIPMDYDKRIKLGTESTLSAVRRAALLTNEESKGIKLALEKGTMTFSCRAPETGDARIDMPVDYQGERIEIGFNPQFLIDVLRAIKANEFELELGQSDRPGMIKSGTSFTYVVMPINLG